MSMPEIEYVQRDKLWFHAETNKKVCDAIRKAYKNEWIVKIYQGNPQTGEVWVEEHDRIGRIGRSTGSVQIPLLIAKGECGGGSLMDHCIVGLKVVDTGEWLYMHPKMKLPDVQIVPSTAGKGYKWSTVIDGVVQSNHMTLEDAYKLREMLST